MNKTNTIVITSVMTVIVCLSLIVGSTFALFASSTTTNIAVASGKVEVVASITDFHMFTRSETGSQIDGKWLSGQAHEQDGQITLYNMAPYDGVTFNIEIVSNSTVAIKWQVQLAFDGESELYNALQVDVSGIELIETDSIRASNWELLAPNSEQAVTTLKVRIELDESALDAQSKNCSIAIAVFAVQANADTIFNAKKHLSIFSK